MTRLNWSDTSKRSIETGLDRGVLYPKNVPIGPVDATNFIINPDFETDISGWTTDFPGTTTLSRDLTQHHSGTACLKAVVTGSGASDLYMLPFVSVGTDLRWSGSLWVKGPIGRQIRVILVSTPSNAEFESGGLVWVTLTGDWQRVTVSGTAPVGATSILYGLYMNDSGTYYFDDFTLSEGLTPLDFNGDTVDKLAEYSWVGTPHASRSQRRSIVGTAIPWVGLTGVDETGAESAVAYYVDGRPFLFLPKPKEFAATLKAYTYPDEFAVLMGLTEATEGMFLDSQQSDSFDLSYRTLIGNLTEGLDAGYKIHLVYNATVAPAGPSYSTMSQSINPNEFSWEIQAVPMPVTGYRATAHVIIDTRNMDADKLAQIEDLIYGSDTIAPSLPSPAEIFDILKFGDTIVITDNGDGTWDAVGSYHNIYLIGDGVFQIDNVNAVDNGDGTFYIATTPAGEDAVTPLITEPVL